MQYICSKTGDEGSVYAATQGMRACNNNNMRNPSLHFFYYGSYACNLIPCFASYILPSSPVLLHIYTASVSLLFGTVIPTSFKILRNVLLSLYRRSVVAIWHLMYKYCTFLQLNVLYLLLHKVYDDGMMIMVFLSEMLFISVLLLP